jgi:hypothetical protein
MATKSITFDADQYIDDWLARKTSVRKIMAETGLSRSSVHSRLKARCDELGINSDGGEGVGLFGIIQTEYLNPKSREYKRMSQRDREKVAEWAEEKYRDLLTMTGDRVYPTAKCNNRTRRDTIGSRDLSEMADTSFGRLWTGDFEGEGLIEIPECEPIGVKIWARRAAPLLFPLFAPRIDLECRIIRSRIPAPLPPASLLFTTRIATYGKRQRNYQADPAIHRRAA